MQFRLHKLGNEELAGKIYWTGSTRSGCAGQYSDCFAENDSAQQQLEVEVLTNKDGEACVAFVSSGDGIIAKTMFCKNKAYLSCQGLRNTTIAASDQV